MKHDIVENPEHYTGGSRQTEAIDWIAVVLEDDEYIGYLKGNVLKYIWRYDRKGKPVEDLKKARWYLSELIEAVEACKRS